MKNALITRNFHPNEHVAYDMAEKVHYMLLADEISSTLIDLEILRKRGRSLMPSWHDELADGPNERYLHLNRVKDAYPNHRLFDFHDSDIEDLKEYKMLIEPIIMDSSHGYYEVEWPAIYIQQEDPEVYRRGKEMDLRTAKYFEQRSSPELTREAGLCTEVSVRNIVNQIINLL